MIRKSFLPGTWRGTIRRTVERNARRCDLNDVLDNNALVLKHLPGRNAEHVDLVTRQPIVALEVPHGPITEAMTLAIDLDCQPRLHAEKIKHIRTSWMLTPELEAARPHTQSAPQQPFGQAQRAPQSSRKFDDLPRSGEHSAFPSTMLCMVPLPVPGRNYI